MIKILSNSNASEGYILDPQGKLIGKVTLPELIKKIKRIVVLLICLITKTIYH